jgi:uncharacterized protein YndB with AHSA1/START domain
MTTLTTTPVTSPWAHPRTLRFTSRVELDAPPASVWSIVADYGRDPQWRRGVRTMAPSPAGLVQVGTTTAEVLRLGGRTYRSAGIVTEVDEGRRFTWHTTSGAAARGWREVRPLRTGGTEVVLHLEVGLHGAQRLMRPVLERMLGGNLAGDSERLRGLVLAQRRSVPS